MAGMSIETATAPPASGRPDTEPPARPEVNWHEHHSSRLTSGERAADMLRNGMGSWWFVVAFLGFMGVWALLNFAESAWDPYPYILLNLVLSTLAGLQGSILLIAARRQDALASALARNDFETNAAAKAEIEALTALVREQSELLVKLTRERGR